MARDSNTHSNGVDQIVADQAGCDCEHNEEGQPGVKLRCNEMQVCVTRCVTRQCKNGKIRDYA